MTSTLGPIAYAHTDDGRRLEYARLGSGTPLVVFEAGMGSGRHAWSLVAPSVAAHTSVVTYNRAGFGASTFDPQPRTAVRATADLLDLLAHVDAGPVILVGHSYGGVIVREAAAIAPTAVAGLVLVDQTDEGCELYFAPSVEKQGRAMGAVLPALARVGLSRPIARGVARALPAADRNHVVDESAPLPAARTHRSEQEHCDAELRRLRDHPHTPLDVPVTLISGAHEPRGRTARARRECLVAAHARRAAATPRGRHVLAPRSGHMIMFSEPQLVVDEILRLVR